MRHTDGIAIEPNKASRSRAKASRLIAVGAASAMGIGGIAVSAALSGASTTSVKASSPTEVELATVPKYGKILVTKTGLALYYDTANKPGKWACTGDCLTAWPALTLAKGQTAVMAGKGVTGLGTVKSPSGTQVTWHGKALYTFIKDKKGSVDGQGIGKVWFVAQAAKAAVTNGATTSGTSTTPTTKAASSSWS
jgi:predicted lipoprotein with Yx(FWY)xxD motif